MNELLSDIAPESMCTVKVLVGNVFVKDWGNVGPHLLEQVVFFIFFPLEGFDGIKVKRGRGGEAFDLVLEGVGVKCNGNGYVVKPECLLPPLLDLVDTVSANMVRKHCVNPGNATTGHA